MGARRLAKGGKRFSQISRLLPLNSTTDSKSLVEMSAHRQDGRSTSEGEQERARRVQIYFRLRRNLSDFGRQERFQDCCCRKITSTGSVEYPSAD